MEGFWLQDEEPLPWGIDLGDIVAMLRGEEGKKLLPLTIQVNVPYGGQEMLEITSADEDNMEDGDMMLKGLLGKERAPIEIWWNDEAKCGHVDSSCFLDGYLERFVQRLDLLPPVDRSLEQVEIYELSELPFEAVRDLAMALDLGDPEDELTMMAVVYGENAEVALAETLKGKAIHFTGRDANESEITKFVVGLICSSDFDNLCSNLQKVNEVTELTFDVVVMWDCREKAA